MRRPPVLPGNDQSSEMGPKSLTTDCLHEGLSGETFVMHLEENLRQNVNIHQTKKKKEKKRIECIINKKKDTSSPLQYRLAACD
ncbi:hypothetical protein AVEN_54225-1 [Araneus ventricosus]|uniref:Uncharacterized protein n=1 Tax=Araneus ventricosus TaxID=182803 RepID=A0A4Y2RT67_ARAVE|nr:hypothetical protein AVEN_54225-1 [Araneus ventricosus]